MEGIIINFNPSTQFNFVFIKCISGDTGPTKRNKDKEYKKKKIKSTNTLTTPTIPTTSNTTPISESRIINPIKELQNEQMGNTDFFLFIFSKLINYFFLYSCNTLRKCCGNHPP